MHYLGDPVAMKCNAADACRRELGMVSRVQVQTTARYAYCRQSLMCPVQATRALSHLVPP